MSRGGGSRVYVGGLLDSVRKEDLEREFSKYGKLAHVWVAWNPPGFAFVEFDDERDAEEAVTSLNGQEICGSRVRVEMSKGGRGRGGRGRGRGRGFGGRRGSFRDGGGRGMRGGRGRDRGGRSGGMFSRGSRSNKDRYGDFDMGSRGDRDRYSGRDSYDGDDYYSRPAMSSSFRSRSPVGGRRYMDNTPERM